MLVVTKPSTFYKRMNKEKMICLKRRDPLGSSFKKLHVGLSVIAFRPTLEKCIQFNNSG